MDKPLSYYAFEMLYWCGVREGGAAGPSPRRTSTLRNRPSPSQKSYQRIKGQDVVTDPKTAKSNRVIQMPAFLCDEMEDYIKSLYAVEPTDRIFMVTKSYLHREMDRGAKRGRGQADQDTRPQTHSHISLLIDMGFTALAIADRVGHESIDITYRYAHLFPHPAGGDGGQAGHGAKGGLNHVGEKTLITTTDGEARQVAFRVSPEEDEQLETAVRLSGLTKQDYITRRLLGREVVVQGNPTGLQGPAE